MMHEPLNTQEIKRHLDSENLLGSQFLLFESINSTNDYAKQNVDMNGTVILAERQTAGRGRLGRDWVAPARKGILMSLVLFPEPGFSIPLLNLASGVAVADALDSLYSLNVTVRWPNDVFVNGKKIAGVLAETQFRGSDISKFILGIGLNVHQSRDDFPAELRKPATSLRQETNVIIDRNRVAAFIINALDKKIRALESGNTGVILREWKEISDQIGKPIRHISGKESRVGIFKDLSARGTVIAEFGGLSEEISTGELILDE